MNPATDALRLQAQNAELLQIVKQLCPLTHYATCHGLIWRPGPEREAECTCGAAVARAALALAEEEGRP